MTTGSCNLPIRYYDNQKYDNEKIFSYRDGISYILYPFPNLTVIIIENNNDLR